MNKCESSRINATIDNKIASLKTKNFSVAAAVANARGVTRTSGRRKIELSAPMGCPMVPSAPLLFLVMLEII